MPVDHYENFPVASLLLPRRLRRPIEAIYRFARAADDIADEGDAPDAVRLQGLAEYGDELTRIERGEPPLRPAFAELAAIVAEWRLPVPLLRDLLDAFAQDVVKKRYADYPELLDYCRRSANPVGRLLLHLVGTNECREPAPLGLHLQRPATRQFLAGRGHRLAQGSRLSAAGRPRALRRCRGADRRRRWSAEWAALLDFECERTRRLMLAGAPLVHQLPGRMGWEIRLTVQGGLRILERIRQVRGDVFPAPPGARRRRLAAHRQTRACSCKSWENDGPVEIPRSPMTPTNTARRRLPAVARASTTASSSCRRISGARSRRSMPSAGKSTMSSMSARTRRSPPPSWPGGGRN
jgi:phytoene/squalene synthetase